MCVSNLHWIGSTIFFYGKLMADKLHTSLSLVLFHVTSEEKRTNEVFFCDFRTKLMQVVVVFCFICLWKLIKTIIIFMSTWKMYDRICFQIVCCCFFNVCAKLHSIFDKDHHKVLHWDNTTKISQISSSESEKTPTFARLCELGICVLNLLNSALWIFLNMKNDTKCQ